MKKQPKWLCITGKLFKRKLTQIMKSLKVTSLRLIPWICLPLVVIEELSIVLTFPQSLFL